MVRYGEFTVKGLSQQSVISSRLKSVRIEFKSWTWSYLDNLKISSREISTIGSESGVEQILGWDFGMRFSEITFDMVTLSDLLALELRLVISTDLLKSNRTSLIVMLVILLCLVLPALPAWQAHKANFPQTNALWWSSSFRFDLATWL